MFFPLCSTLEPLYTVQHEIAPQWFSTADENHWQWMTILSGLKKKKTFPSMTSLHWIMLIHTHSHSLWKCVIFSLHEVLNLHNPLGTEQETDFPFDITECTQWHREECCSAQAVISVFPTIAPSNAHALCMYVYMVFHELEIFFQNFRMTYGILFSDIQR